MCRRWPLVAPDERENCENGESPELPEAVGVELVDPLRPPNGQRLEPLTPPLDAAVGLLRSLPPLRNLGSDSDRSTLPAPPSCAALDGPAELTSEVSVGEPSAVGLLAALSYSSWSAWPLPCIATAEAFDVRKLTGWQSRGIAATRTEQQIFRIPHA